MIPGARDRVRRVREGKHGPTNSEGGATSRRGILDDDDLATGFDHSEDFAQRQFTVAIRLLMQQKEYQCSIVNRIRQPQPAGVHGQQPHRRSRRQLGFQVSELDRQTSTMSISPPPVATALHRRW